MTGSIGAVSESSTGAGLQAAAINPKESKTKILRIIKNPYVFLNSVENLNARLLAESRGQVIDSHDLL